MLEERALGARGDDEGDDGGNDDGDEDDDQRDAITGRQSHLF